MELVVEHLTEVAVVAVEQMPQDLQDREPQVVLVVPENQIQ
jgi:predicted Zn-dependent protease with MMP-like domain